MREAVIERNTKETQIQIKVILDGKGVAEIHTGIGFFDHMLTALAVHSGISMYIQVAGDLHVDAHHTVEDTGIVLGQCFEKALGNCAGIYRSGCFLYPMDESLCRAAVDFGGRPYLVCEADLTGIPLVSIGQNGKESSFQTDCFEDFWQGFTANAKCNLHLDVLRGRSDHHKMEGLFKACARAIRQAVEQDSRRDGEIPSTKGVIV